MRKAILFGWLVLFVSGCYRAPLEVDFVYVGGRSLASYWVCTPDPELCDPPTGQKLVVLWQLSKAEWDALVDPKLCLKVRFANREEKTLWWDVTTNKGKAIYVHVGTRDNPCPAINTYRAEIVSEGKVAYVVEQALWTEWIALQGAGTCSSEEPARLSLQSEPCEGVEGVERKGEEDGVDRSIKVEESKGYSWDDLEEIDCEKKEEKSLGYT